MVGEEEDWQTSVEAAVTDDSLAAAMLMQLSHGKRVAAPETLKWGLRLPRSKQITMRAIRQAKQEEIRLASPTTPLSFSGGGTAPSGDGACVESSRYGRSPGSGDGTSKIAVNEASTSRSTVRRTKRKKTIVELKGEENFLMLEQIDLKKEIEALTNSCKVLREEGEKLKLTLERRPNPSSFTQQGDSKTSTSAFVLPDLNLPPEEV